MYGTLAVPSRPFSSAAASANSLLTTVCMGHNYPSPEEFAYFEKGIYQREPAS